MSGTIQITLPDGSKREIERGTSGHDFAASISRSLGKDAIGLIVDGALADIRAPLNHDAEARILTKKDEEALEVLRHSMAHAMAQAFTRVFPKCRLAFGPTVEDGFYYDIEVDRPLTPEDLKKVEKEMARVVKEDHAIERFVLSREAALEWAREQGQGFKEEHISGLPQGEEISFYRQGDFVDLCAGPHVLRTSKLGTAFKLMKVAGAYWRGDEKREQLQRVYGTAWFSKEDLDDHLTRLEEAKKRDHRRLGKELDLFSFHPEAPAMPFFHPKGAVVYNLLIDYVRDLYRTHGYGEVITPQVLDVDLWHKSGHYDNYRENMYFTRFEREDEDGPGGAAAPDGQPPAAQERGNAVKPMNCPTHCLIYRTRKRSYRDLPIRYADFGRLHRYERSGVTAGLLRVRSFAQDDSHIFCTQDQIEAEVTSVTEMILTCYRKFGFDNVEIALSTRPEKSTGSTEMWEKAEAALRSALDQMGIAYRVEPGEGAFYGPKIDFTVRDALKRPWQLGTCQLDFSMPSAERFDLRYNAASGGEEQVVMIHRAMLGSIERFLGVLIEHTGGAFPAWLAPVQARVLPISLDQADRATEVADLLRHRGIRAEADVRNEKIGLKVRDAALAKVPFQLIIGARELEQGTVSVRARGADGDLGEMELDKFPLLLSDAGLEKT